MKIYNILIAENDYITKMILAKHTNSRHNIIFIEDFFNAIEATEKCMIDVVILDLDIPNAESYGILNYFELKYKLKPEIIVFSQIYHNYFLKNRDITILNKPLNVDIVKNLIKNTCTKLKEKNLEYIIA